MQLFYRDLTTGTEKQLLQATAPVTGATDVSTNGQLIAFFQTGPAGADIFTMPVDATRTPSRLLAKAFDARFSPDGRFVAFISSESGQSEVYVTPLSASATRKRVSTAGADMPRWNANANSRELVYRSADGHIVSVTVSAKEGQPIEVGSPLTLFATKGKWPWRDFDISPDGKRLLAIMPRLMAGEQPLTVVLNWSEEAGR